MAGNYFNILLTQLFKYNSYLCSNKKGYIMLIEQTLLMANFQEQDGRSFTRKTLAYFIPTIDGIPVERMEIV